MSVTAQVLIKSQYAPSSMASMYTSQAGTTTIVDNFTATNNTASPAIISVYVVPSGETASASNLISYYTVGANTPMLLPEMKYKVLEPGDFIAVLAGTASAIAIQASGRQST